MKKKTDWGEIGFSVFIFIVTVVPVILGIGYWIKSAISPSTKQSESAEPTTDIVAYHSSEPSPSPSLNPDYDADDADRDFQQAASWAIQAVEDGEYDGNWIDLADSYLADNADYQYFIHTSPSPSPSKVPTPVVIPSPTPTEDPYSGEQFAMLYDGAALRYVTVIAEGISDIPSWLRIDAYIDNGVEDFDICAPVDDSFETNDIPIYYPSQFVIRFSFEIDSSNLDGDLIDYSAPENGYVEFVLDSWALDEYEDGNLHGTIEETFSVYYEGSDGEEHMEEAYFCPEITVQLQ